MLWKKGGELAGSVAKGARGSSQRQAVCCAPPSLIHKRNQRGPRGGLCSVVKCAQRKNGNELERHTCCRGQGTRLWDEVVVTRNIIS